MTRKRLAIAGGVILLLLVAVVLALPWLVDVNRYRGDVQAALRERLTREVMLGEMRLSLLPLGVRVQDVVIADDPRFGTERPFARVAELYVSPRVLPLLSGRFELRAVELRRPAIELVRDASGTWNFASLGGPDAAPVEPESNGSTFVLNRLTIARGQVALTDLQPSATGAPAPGRAVYDNIDLELEDYAPDRAFDIELTATLPGEGTQRLSVQGTGGPIVQDAVAMTPFEGTLELEDVSISGAQRFLQLDALDGTDSVISGSADLGNRDGRMTAKGSLQLDETRARNVPIDYPITAEFDVAYDSQPQLVTITAAEVRLDETPLSLTGTADLRPETPLLDVRVTASNASLEEAARLASAFGVAFGAGTRVQGTLNADVRARGPATLPALEGRAGLRDVVISGGDIAQPVRTPSVDFTLSPEEVRSNEFTVTTGNTSVAVAAAARQYTSERPSIDARIRAGDSDLGEILTAARAWGVEGTEGVTGSGRVSLDVHATGPVDALTFAGSGSLRDATLRTPAIAQPLQIRNAALSFSKDAATLEKLSASVGKTNAEGRLTVRNFAAPDVQFQLSADRIDVAEMQALVVPAKEAPGTAKPADTSALRSVTGSGMLRVGAIAYDALLLENVQATATLDHGLIRLDPVTAGLFGGTHRGAIVMDARQTPTTFSIASELQKVDANRLASAMTNVRDIIFGALGTKVQMQFSGDGGDSFARSLNGTMSLNLDEGRIANMNITQEVATIASFVTGAARAERTTQVAGLTGTFDVKNGVATTSDLTAGIEGGTMGAVGSVNLADQTVNLRLTTVLSREFSDRVGGTRVGGFMNTALANQQGELVVPMLVTGTLQSPRFAPDAQRIAEMKVKNLVPNLRDPQGLAGSILGAVRGQPSGEGSRPGLGGIVDAIRGGTGQNPAAQPPAAEGTPEDKPAQPDGSEAKPQPRDRGREVEDALRGIFGGRKKQEPQPAPDQK